MKEILGIRFAKCLFFILVLTAVMIFRVPSSVKPPRVHIDLPETRQEEMHSTASMENVLASVTMIRRETASIVQHSNTGTVAAMWIDGRSVPMSDKQVAEFEDKLYSCKTQEEYEAMMRTLSYYDKGVNLSRFSWFWDEMEDLYSDEQIAMMKSGKVENQVLPDVVGMKARDAYHLLTGMGFLARIAYNYNSDCKLPVDYCYGQDIAPGSLINTNASIILNVQAPKELLEAPMFWDPDDTDFDIFKYAQNLRENGKYSIILPNVVGLYCDDAKRCLEEAGYKHVTITYRHVSDDILPGYCFEQVFQPGWIIYNTTEIFISAQILPPNLIDIPDVVGMQSSDAVNALIKTGLCICYYYVDESDSGIAEGCCIRQDYTVGARLGDSSINLYIQKSSVESESVTESTSASESSIS